MLVGLSLSLVSQATFAQYSTTIPMQTNAPSPTKEHHGEGLVNAGKTLMFTGASVALTSITVGNSVASIGIFAFSYCASLTSIKYRGTEEQWNAITKGTDWDTGTASYTITTI